MARPLSPASVPRADPSASRRLLSGTIAALACLLYGYCSGVVAGAQLYVSRDFSLGTTAQGAVVSVFLLGAAAGALGAGRVSDRYGRRPALLLSALLFGAGLALAAFAPGLPLLLVGRVVQGLAAGLASAVVPVYLSEISTDRARGRMGTLNQFMVTVGLLVSYLVALAYSSGGEWRWMFGAGLAGVAVFLLALPLLPESPVWRQRGEEAARKLPGPRAALRVLTSRGVRPALLVGLGLCLLQQFCGINAVLYFAPTIIRSTGLGASNAILYSVYIGALNVVMTILAVELVDRWGRRPLMLLSVGLMFVALVPLGVSFMWDVPAHSLVALLCLLGYVAAFAIGLGPVVWLLLAEIFPPEQRALGTAVCTTVNWLANFVVNQFFLTLVGALGQGETFWLFAGVCLLGLGFVWHRLPETRGRDDAAVAAELGTGTVR
ncbi:MFS transporter [Streptomyces sp. NPDC088923]|uniref:MFS transporter n=1 Tax=Streptomyces sp. NPDC088923 TaxID=3365913 RepID=UPI0037F7F014